MADTARPETETETQEGIMAEAVAEAEAAAGAERALATATDTATDAGAGAGAGRPGGRLASERELGSTMYMDGVVGADGWVSIVRYGGTHRAVGVAWLDGDVWHAHLHGIPGTVRDSRRLELVQALEQSYIDGRLCPTQWMHEEAERLATADGEDEDGAADPTVAVLECCGPLTVEPERREGYRVLLEGDRGQSNVIGHIERADPLARTGRECAPEYRGRLLGCEREWHSTSIQDILVAMHESRQRAEYCATGYSRALRGFAGLLPGQKRGWDAAARKTAALYGGAEA